MTSSNATPVLVAMKVRPIKLIDLAGLMYISAINSLLSITAAVIDNNEFIADIYIKPARSINFIGLTFIATRTGVAFEEVIGNV